MNAFTGTNDSHSKQPDRREGDAYNSPPPFRRSAMSRIEELADRVERLLLRHEEVQRTNALLTTQLGSVTNERDNLRSSLETRHAAGSTDFCGRCRASRSPPATGTAVDGNDGETLQSVRMKQVEVTILGQSYLLGCPDGGEKALLEAVAAVDREMSAIRDGGKVKARERIAVLAALNLAFALAERPEP